MVEGLIFFVFFVVGAHVVGARAVKDFVDDFGDHGEPDAAEDLQREEQREEVVSYTGVPADGALLVVVGLEQVAPDVGAAVGLESCRVGDRDE